MAEIEKIVAVNTFEGAQNTDIADELMPANQVRSYFNCLILSSGDGNYGIVTNLNGNELIRTPLPEGENKEIGTATDEENKKIYFAIWNSNGFHSWLVYSEVNNSIVKVIELKTDTRGVEIWKWKKSDKIIQADVYHGNLLYWVLDGPWKINIAKCMDKSSSGYGDEILEEYTRAYKLTSIFAPKASYSTNPNIPYNQVYGSQFKFATRFIYDDFEKSNYSDYSNVPNPENESNQGGNSVSNENNCIEVSVETGSSIVTDIEIIMQKTLPDGSISPWYQIAVIKKQELSLGDNAIYIYKFYNDGTYLDVDQLKVARPHSFMPKYPKCQAIVKNAIVYSNSQEGFPTVLPDIELSVSYQDLFDDSSYETQMNSPFIGLSGYTYSERSWFKEWVHSVLTVTIGPDVKKGNVFRLWSDEAVTKPNFEYTATAIDDNRSVANFFVAQILKPDRFKSVTAVTAAGGGAVQFTFDYMHEVNSHSKPFYVSAKPVLYSLLKDYGQNLRTFKLGSSRSFAIRYYDEDGRKSSYYIAQGMNVKFDPINQFGKAKLSVVTAEIKHRPPVWARYWEFLIGPDLTYNNGHFIQIFIQKVIDFKATENTIGGESYLDLVVGSLFTYQKIHPNTTLKYEFKKGDRLRLIKKIDIDSPTLDEVYYDFFETEVLQYQDSVTELVNDVITTNGTNVVQTTTVDFDHLGLILEIDGIERTISQVNADGYVLDRLMPESRTYPNFRIINRNGIVRIKKPNSPNIFNYSLVEIYTPSLNSEDLGVAAFYEFGHKYPIIDWGTEARMHGGNFQQQTALLPAIIKVSNGMSYVRKRELPTNNSVKNTQVVVSTVEDPSFSDYYSSAMYDTGRAVPKDDKMGVIDFIDRCYVSNNSIEDTKINGFNDFDNLDRVDYNDNSGAIVLTISSNGKLFVFKELKSGWSPIYGRIIRDQEGQTQLGLYDKVLSPNLEYYSFDGGMGNHSESYVKNENNHYFFSPGTLSICRVGGNGVDPISEIYGVDTEIRKTLGEATKNNARINFGYDRANRVVLASIEDYDKILFNDPFNEEVWKISNDLPEQPSEIEVTTQPVHGIATVNELNIIYVSTAGYVGDDSVWYRAKISGNWTAPKELLLKVVSSEVKTYKNEVQKKVFYKECPGGRGSAVEYTVPAGKYESTLSLDDANNQAILDIQSNGQKYANDHGTCIYINSRQSRSFSKNDCANGGIGSSVTMVAEEGDFTSTISETDANNKAINYLNTNGQAYANSNGSCSWKNDEKSGTFYKTDCNEGTVPEPYTYIVQAGKYSSSISKADANTLADNDVNTNGQIAANTNGICTLMVSIRFGYWDSQGNTSKTFGSMKLAKVNAVSYDLDFDAAAVSKFIGIREPISAPVKNKWQVSGGTKQNINIDFDVIEENGYRYYFSKNVFFDTEIKTLNLSVS